jgi:hypothetical protein
VMSMYSGSFTFDTVGMLVSHRPAASIFPEYLGRTLVRKVEFPDGPSGQRLLLTGSNGLLGTECTMEFGR